MQNNKFIFLSFFIILLLSGFMLSSTDSTLVSPKQKISSETIVRRAAFDFGSGSLRLQIADVDRETNRIIQTLFSDKVIVELSQSLSKSSDGTFDQNTQETALKAVQNLLQKAELYQAEEVTGIATEAFRLAKNGQELVDLIRSRLGVSFRIIPQDEEGEVGFASAVSVAQADPDKTIVWDIGGGSLQIVARNGSDYDIYKEQLGKVPMKNYIISQLQHKDVDQTFSPNPISKEQAIQAIRYVKEKGQEMPEELVAKLHDPEVKVLGIGAHPASIRCLHRPYTVEEAREKIFELVGLDDDELQQLYPSGIAYVLSDTILVYGTMLATGIAEVQYIDTMSGNTAGVLTTPSYWEGM